MVVLIAGKSASVPLQGLYDTFCKPVGRQGFSQTGTSPTQGSYIGFTITFFKLVMTFYGVILYIATVSVCYVFVMFL